MTNSLLMKQTQSQPLDINCGSLWFRRLYRECKQISPYIRFKRIKMGFYRIYFKQAYVSECYKEMPMNGYDYEDTDPRFEFQKYYEEFEDQAELTRKIKNYVEGYYDSIRNIKIRVNNMMTDPEAYQKARDAYKVMKIY